MSYRVAWLFSNFEFIFIDYSNKLYGNGLNMNILVLSGSPRKDGNTDLLVESFVKGASQKHQVEVVSVHDYKINRNPMLTGTLIYLVGAAVWLWTWQSCAVFVAFFAIMMVQVLSEEKRLRRDFGEEYEEYCRHSRRF